MDIAVVGVGASIALDETGEQARSARIALAAVAPTPVLATRAAGALVDRELNEDAFEDAARLATEVINPIDDMRGSMDERRHLTYVLTKRALRGAVERARRAAA
jgi:carbon-monoxide dehydrogenase medium subunit